MKLIVVFVNSLILATGLLATNTLAQVADAIYHNGSIVTMAGDEPTYAEALVVKDGKILFVGTKERRCR